MMGLLCIINIGLSRLRVDILNQNERILYIDENLAIFNKKAGEICETWTSTSQEDKSFYVPQIFLDSDFSGRVRPSFCQCFNRLDRPVSGTNLLIFNKSLFPLLQNQFTNSQKNIKSVKKEYWAIVEGIVKPQKNFELLEHYLKFDSKKQKAYCYNTEERKTKKAQLKWRSIGHGENYSFLQIELITGRTHQIRAQLAHIGFHIKGDVKYGARRQDSLPGIRLHARSLYFIHPKTKNVVSAIADVPNLDPLWKAFKECVDG